MRIDGKLIAQKILENLKRTVAQSSLSPTLFVILVGESPASISYIKQKEKASKLIGAKIIVKKMAKSAKLAKLAQLVQEANKNSKTHGIIVQLPLPEHLNPNEILPYITLDKDVDGFTPNSPFTPPVAMAIIKILEEVKHLGRWQAERSEAMTPPRWTELKFLVIGRGLTAGKPIAKTLRKLGYQVTIAHSQTRLAQLAKLVKSADVIVSCVGKPDIVKAEDLKPGAIVIGVGIHRELTHLRGEKSGESRTGVPATGGGDTSEVNVLKWKLMGDFDEEEISKVASFYTPTPGGIGPINVACLMENLVKAALNQTQTSP
ncbi:bifunctional 5,10-methylenetetrahydrofolate dehydrogenase/5,10-methenyltetrahydrofolate cyclohydrolase [Candidatus Gottesmanbacteria bacterium]|nr:bifunctional 5,10-methylenetetrahydrofolate dehydrogenase/5,10-methenyltetrahydrofolate cyclohydrolase [Candidatus Gottesmanbacteria bacterium]